MKYIVYQTLNLVNNKIYIGVHKTDNPNIFDGYLGCGLYIQHKWLLKNPITYFHKAVQKYGVDNFRRTTIKEFNTLQEALNLERELVDLAFIKRKDTYNIVVGGQSGSSYFPIYQFSLDGKLIQQWDNQKIAAEAMGVQLPSINTAIIQKKSSCGYFWSKTSTIDSKEYSYHIGRRVYQYYLNGILKATYETATKAEQESKFKLSAICRAITCQQQYKGYYWSYKLYETFKPKKVSLKGRVLYIYSLEGKFLTELKSVKEVKKYYNAVNPMLNIKEAIMKGRPYKNTQISLEKVSKLSKVDYSIINKAKKIGKYDIKGNLLEEFDSIKAAVKAYGSKVSRVLKSKQSKTIEGFIFKYL